MNDFEEQEEVIDPKTRHLKEVLSRRSEEERHLLIHQALDKLREELYSDEV